MVQVSTMETSLREISDIFDINGSRGLSHDIIQKLPEFMFHSMETCSRPFQDISCAICLQVSLILDQNYYVSVVPKSQAKVYIAIVYVICMHACRISRMGTQQECCQVVGIPSTYTALMNG